MGIAQITRSCDGCGKTKAYPEHDGPVEGWYRNAGVSLVKWEKPAQAEGESEEDYALRTAGHRLAGVADAELDPGYLDLCEACGPKAKAIYAQARTAIIGKLG